MMPALLDETGHRHGRLEVVERAAKNSRNGHAKWTCRCDCGVEVQVCGGDLRSGRSRSCGCWRSELAAGWARTLGRTYGGRRHAV